MFDINDRVSHWNYGEGTVLGKEYGEGVVVRFDEDGQEMQVYEHDLELIDDGAWDDYQERQWERKQLGLCRF